MPASGFLISCAITAAISPTRGQPIAQPLAFLELLDARQVLEEQRRADDLRRRRRGPATACSRSPCPVDFSRSSARLGSVVSSKAPPSTRTMSGCVVEHVGEGRPMSLGRGQAEDAAGLVVHQHEPCRRGRSRARRCACCHHVPEETIVESLAAGAVAARRRRGRRASSATATQVVDAQARMTLDAVRSGKRRARRSKSNCDYT